jgi:SAM-dependent methyltransferase
MKEETRQRTEDQVTSRNCGTKAWQAKAASGWEREALASGLDGGLAGSGSGQSTEGESQRMEKFFREYTSHGEILKYTKATAGFGINYLLEHDYKTVYLNALNFLPQQTREGGIRILEFGCGGGMNLLHLISMLKSEGIHVASALGTDFSPAMIETARREAKNYLREEDLQNLEFHVAKNESLISDLSGSRATEESTLKNSFHFILGVNTIRYCHDAKRQRDCVRDIFNLLVPGGVCVVIDMNNRFPLFRSDLKNRVRRHKEKQCYVPSLEEYAAPFVKEGFELLRTEHFCWVPHSAGPVMAGVLRTLSPILNTIAHSRAMRSLVVAKKPS